MKIYTSPQECSGPSLRFIENILLEYIQSTNTIKIFFLKDEANLAAKIIYTIYFFTEYNAKFFIEEKKITIAKLSLEELDSLELPQAIFSDFTQRKITISVKLRDVHFKHINTHIFVAAENDAEAL